MQGGEVRDDARLALQQQLRARWICLQEVAEGDAHVPQVLHPICSTNHAQVVAPQDCNLALSMEVQGSAVGVVNTLLLSIPGTLR